METDEELKFAYFGVSIKELNDIAATGKMITEGDLLFCEGGHRKQYALANTVHRFSHDGPSEDSHLYAAVIELAVNRTQGAKIGRQWTQKPDSTYITGVFFHTICIRKAFEPGIRGWLQNCDFSCLDIGIYKPV